MKHQVFIFTPWRQRQNTSWKRW